MIHNKSFRTQQRRWKMCITNNDCPNIWWLDETLEIPTSKKTSHKNKHEWLLFKCNKFFFKYFCVAHFKYNISRIKRMKCLPFFWINYREVGMESSHQISTSALPYLDCSSISAITRFNLDLFCQCITKTNRNSFWRKKNWWTIKSKLTRQSWLFWDNTSKILMTQFCRYSTMILFPNAVLLLIPRIGFLT